MPVTATNANANTTLHTYLAISHQPSDISHRTPPLAGFPLPARRDCAGTKRIRRRPHENVRRPRNECFDVAEHATRYGANLVSAKYPGRSTTPAPRPFHPPWEENNK
jgi:hypothetical protein